MAAGTHHYPLSPLAPDAASKLRRLRQRLGRKILSPGQTALEPIALISTRRAARASETALSHRPARCAPSRISRLRKSPLRALNGMPTVPEAAKTEPAKDAGSPHTQAVCGRPRTQAGDGLQPSSGAVGVLLRALSRRLRLATPARRGSRIRTACVLRAAAYRAERAVWTSRRVARPKPRRDTRRRMSRNVEIMRAAMEAFNRRDGEGLGAFLAKDAEIVPVRAALEGTVYRGPNAGAQYCAAVEVS